jgi:hypothetical protein
MWENPVILLRGEKMGKALFRKGLEVFGCWEMLRLAAHHTTWQKTFNNPIVLNRFCGGT